ncbi:MAG: aldo/keto reductase family oxidoreductase [Lachnospiraceae bacterium]
MNYVELGTEKLKVSAIAVGCMRIYSMDGPAITSFIGHCMEKGLNFFDHADIYGSGECEAKFGLALKDTGYQREELILQTKCGIHPGVMFDFSKEHILASVDASLKRLNTDYLDILLLHRPDALVEPEEVAEAFDILEKSGKVRHFGVSNQKPMQIELLRKYVKQPLVANQLQLSIPFSSMIANGLEVNMLTDNAVDRDGSILDYCRLHDITIQTWSPFQYGYFEGVFLGSDKFPELNAELEKIAAAYQVTPTAIATAWILRHPAKMQMVSGTTTLSRIDEISAGTGIQLTREEWYRIYLSAGHKLP